MPDQGIVSIGLNIDYQKALQQMESDFNKALTQISNDAKKIKYTADVQEQIEAMRGEIKGFSDEFRAEFAKISSQKIDSSNFEKFETEVKETIESVEGKFASLNTKIYNLRKQFGLLDDSDFATGMKKQFEGLTQTVLNLYKGLQEVVGLTKLSDDSLIDAASLDKYQQTLALISRFNSKSSTPIKGNWGQIQKEMIKQEELLKNQIVLYEEIKLKMSSVDPSSDRYLQLENELVKIQTEASITAGKIQNIFKFAQERGFKPELGIGTSDLMLKTEGFADEIIQFESKIRKIISANKEAQNEAVKTQGTFNSFKIKDGAIHVPVDILASSSELKEKLNGVIEELKTYAKSNPVVANVKLVLDKSSSKGYKNNAEIDKQQVDGQAEPAIDISKAMKRTYTQAVREAERTAKDAIKAIQAIFDGSPIKITPDTEAFQSKLRAMIDKSFKEIAKDTTGLNVNSNLEKLVANLKEVAATLSGGENFKFGLDEASIERITAAINNMANMIQRAFGVASDSDIATQWSTIESKFRAVAGEEGRLLKGNKEHKVAIQELAVEYKKYLDMGGKNDLSTLTSHKQTVKNITAEYENLGKAAQEAAQKQEQTKKKPASTKISSEEKEAINAVSRENKKLETQAVKTGTALDNEGNSAQTAAGKFRKLAKEKGAAVDANRELAKAAKETADALEREAKARKETGTKTGKGAVDNATYSSNYLKWQSEIKQSLMDSGNYADIYNSKVSQAADGTVKFTAVVRDLDGNLKEFSAKVNDLGKIFSPSISDMSEKKTVSFEKELADAERLRELIMSMSNVDTEDEDPIKLDRNELELYSAEIQKILNDLGALSNTTYKIKITDGGRLEISAKDLSASGAKAEEFTAYIDRIDSVFEETADGVKISAAKIREALEYSFDGARLSTSTKEFVSSAQDAFNKFTLKHKGDSNWSSVAKDMEMLEQRIAGIDSKGKLNEFKQNLSDIAVKLSSMGKDSKLGDILGEGRTFGNINEVRANIDSLFASMGKVNEKSIRVSGTNKLTAEVKAANGEIRKMTVNLDSKGFARFVDNGIVQFGRLREAVSGIFSGIWGYFRYYLSPYMLVSYTRTIIDKLKELDTAMTELKKVSDAPEADIAAYFKDATESAKELGSTVRDMIAATADWSRMGYNLPDSRALGEVAVLYKNVGDGIDIDTANESLVSTIQGFQLQAKDAMSVIDAFNEVSNNYAISSAGIGEALKRSAAAFNAANTDLNQSIALITAGNEIVQSPEKVGTMWQTVSARIRGKICAHCTVMCRPPYEDNIKAA